jgi:hypothetical protein
LVITPVGLGPEMTALAIPAVIFNYRPVLWSERESHINTPITNRNKNLVMRLR